MQRKRSTASTRLAPRCSPAAEYHAIVGRNVSFFRYRLRLTALRPADSPLREKSTAPPWCESSGGMTGPCIGPLWGARPDSKRQRVGRDRSVGWHARPVPLRRKALDFIEIQD